MSYCASHPGVCVNTRSDHQHMHTTHRTQMVDHAYRRAVESFEASVAAYEQRVQNGTQPHTPWVDLFSMDVQEKVLVGMNVGYLLLACVLSLLMRRREVWSIGLGGAAPCPIGALFVLTHPPTHPPTHLD